MIGHGIPCRFRFRDLFVTKMLVRRMTMAHVNLSEAKAHLSELVARAEAGRIQTDQPAR